MDDIVQFETPVEIEEEKDLGLVSFVEDFNGCGKRRDSASRGKRTYRKKTF